MKIDQQPQLPSAKFEIAEQLSVVDRKQSFDGFDLHNDQVGHKKIQPITAVQPDAFVIQR